MKKKFKLEGLECANCAAKMEEGISKLSGVESCAVNFMAAKLILNMDDSMEEAILEEVQKIIHKYESGCNIVK